MEKNGCFSRLLRLQIPELYKNEFKLQAMKPLSSAQVQSY